MKKYTTALILQILRQRIEELKTTGSYGAIGELNWLIELFKKWEATDEQRLHRSKE